MGMVPEPSGSEIDQAISLLMPQGESPAPEPEVEAPEVDIPALEAVHTPDPEGIPEESDTEEQEAAPQADTLKSLAEKSGLKLSDIYKIEVPGKDGSEPITLGQLKDKAQDFHNLDVSRQDFEQKQTQWVTDRNTAIGQLQELVKSLPQQSMTPQAIQQMQGLAQQHMAQEQAMLHQSIPEWSEPGVQTEQVGHMVGTAQLYGISEQDLGQMGDHRWMRILHALAMKDARIAQLQDAKVRPTLKTQKPHARNRKKPDALDKRVQQKQSQGDKVGAITELLMG
jgi:hypothetical protein